MKNNELIDIQVKKSSKLIDFENYSNVPSQKTPIHRNEYQKKEEINRIT